MNMKRVVLLAAMSVLLLVGAGGASVSLDFKHFDESNWIPAREDQFPTPGTFVQKDGYILNGFPEGISEEDLYNSKGGAGFSMRLLKDVEAKDGRAELEVSLAGLAAPSICFRVQMQNGEVHGPMYNLVIFNQSKPGRVYEGVNLWKWSYPPEGNPAAPKWMKFAYWSVPVPRDQKIKLGVRFRGELIRVFLDGKEIGGVTDKAALGAGKVGMVAIEGPSKFYSFSFTPN